MAITLPPAVFTTGEDVQSYPRLRVEGFNGFAIFTGKQYKRLSVNGNLTGTESFSSGDEVKIQGSFTSKPIVESLRLSARKGEPVTFSVTWLTNANDSGSLPSFTPANQLQDLILFCHSSIYEYTATVTTGYRIIPCSQLQVWVERVGGTIESRGADIDVSGGSHTIKFTNLTVGVAPTESGETADMRWGKNNIYRYDVVGAEGVPMSEPLNL